MSHRVRELHSIMPIENIPSVIRYGILSNEEGAKLPREPASVADGIMQDRRAVKKVPGGLRLHRYAYLYFCARNPMLYKRQNERNRICVLRIARRILSVPGVVLTDQNAASDYVRFLASPSGLVDINFDWVFAEYWTDPNPILEFRRKSTKCAEVLVPNRVAPEYIEGAYETARAALLKTGFELRVELNPKMFFVSG